MSGVPLWRPPPLRSSAAGLRATVAGLLLAGFGSLPVMAQESPDPCLRPAERVAEGWRLYRSGRPEAARQRFEAAEACEATRLAARVGLGYADLRDGRSGQARARFESVLAENDAMVDALVGLALVAWRQGDIGTAADASGRAVELDPGNEEARGVLERTSAVRSGDVRPLERPALVRPDTVVYPSRVRGEGFEIRTAGGWEPFYIKGVNLGAALPGKHPSEFPDSAVYAGWIRDMAEMNANVVRVYTIHPPAFYQALDAHNRQHPERPLWLVHGVWTGLPPEGDYEDAAWEGAFFEEMRRVVDLLHGRADLPHRPGHASGNYTADVSRWTLAYIIGREWEPYSVIEFNALRPELDRWHGRYLTLEGGNPMEAWLAKACEEIIAYEMATYRAQRPVAYTNWPTLDPMTHPTESTVDEEVAIREGFGEAVGKVPLEYDNDAVGLDATLMRATSAFPAGVFASYHAYPYYPDFMILDPEYGRARSSMGPSNYFGYLEDLKRAHPDMPVVIAEYGVPASLGLAHLQPQGWHHGGHDEQAMAEIDVRLTREIAEAGLAGGMLFAWIDEWFKKNWIVIDFEIALERNRLWLNRLDAEQHYGMIAMEPGEIVPGGTAAERAVAWEAHEPLYRMEDGAVLRGAADEAYLWLQYDARRAAPGPLPRRVSVGLDMVDPARGDTRWPGRRGAELPVGLEFVLELTASEARLMADPSANPLRVTAVREGALRDGLRPPGGAERPDAVAGRPPAGVFSGRYEARFARPYRSVRNDDGRYDSLRVVTNRPRFGRDSSEYLAAGYDRGDLPRGTDPDGLWEWLEQERVVEVRIPWGLINVTDPSQRRVLQDLPADVDPRSIGALPRGAADAGTEGAFGTVRVPDIGVVVAVERANGEWEQWPQAGDGAARYGWETWEEPAWRARRRPVFDAMQALFAEPGELVADRAPAQDEAGGGR